VRPELRVTLKFFGRYRAGWIRDGVLLSVGCPGHGVLSTAAVPVLPLTVAAEAMAEQFASRRCKQSAGAEF
jgi:hypothetical protein